MKQRLLILASSLVVILSAHGQAPAVGASDEQATQELIQLERGWVAASVKRDRPWLERFFADEVVTTHPTSGTVKDKAREIADTVDPKMATDSIELGEMHARVIGDVAVVTGTSSETGGGGHLIDRHRVYLFTDTFLRRDGRWQLIASHSSRTGARSSAE